MLGRVVEYNQKTNRWSSSLERSLRKAYRDHHQAKQLWLYGGLDTPRENHAGLLDHRGEYINVRNFRVRYQ